MNFNMSEDTFVKFEIITINQAFILLHLLLLNRNLYGPVNTRGPLHTFLCFLYLFSIVGKILLKILIIKCIKYIE